MRYEKIRQSTPRHFSPWMPVTAELLISCCDCGLVHHQQQRLATDKNGKRIPVWRTKRAAGETAKRRKSKVYVCR